MPLIKASPRAVRKPAASPDPVDPNDLASALTSPDVDERRAAARAAVKSGNMAPLMAHLSQEADQSIRELILNGVLRRKDALHARLLLDLLRCEDVLLRSAVIETLQLMGDTVLPDIQQPLSDPDTDVRIFAVNILQAVRLPHVPDIALKVAMTDDNVNVCAAAVDILAELGRPDMIDALTAVPARFPNQPFLAFAVRAALKRMG